MEVLHAHPDAVPREPVPREGAYRARMPRIALLLRSLPRQNPCEEAAMTRREGLTFEWMHLYWQ